MRSRGCWAAAAGDAGGDAIADHRAAEEDRAVAARAGRGERRCWPSMCFRARTIRDENLSIQKLTADDDISPIIRLVDTTIFTRAGAAGFGYSPGDFRRLSLLVKYRIDGVLQQAMAPIAREHHQTIPFAYQSHVGAGHRRAARAAGWALPGAVQGPADRLPCEHYADCAWRKRCAARAG